MNTYMYLFGKTSNRVQNLSVLLGCNNSKLLMLGARITEVNYKIKGLCKQSFFNPQITDCSFKKLTEIETEIPETNCKITVEY